MKLGIFVRKYAVSVRRATMQIVMAGCALLSFAVWDSASQANAQIFGNPFGTRTGVVGGVFIDAEGSVRAATIAEQQEMLRTMREQYKGAPQELKGQADRRMISLKRLQSTIADHVAAGRPLPEEVLFLGGLTRIENVFLYPEQQDIVIAGPAEGWVVGKNGAFVGEKSGRAVLYLDDLLAAFRTVEAARVEGISCSIEPTAEGSKRYSKLISQIPANQDPRQFESKLKDAFGPQQVLIKGAAPDSHLARVILAADYQMKRYGMNLIEAPVKQLTSYVEMIRGHSNSTPQSRWWMACDYNTLERSDDALAWKISGRGIKTMTEAEMIDSQGNRKQTGKTDALAQKWAENFTARMDDLAVQDHVFGELRNVMDLCVLAALVESQGLIELSHCDLSVLKGTKNSIELAKLGTPTSLPAQCSFLQTSSSWIVTASGGVQIDSWSIASKSKVNDQLSESRTKAKPTDSQKRFWN